MSNLVLCPLCGGVGKYYSAVQSCLEPVNHCHICKGRGAVMPTDFAMIGDELRESTELRSSVAELEQQVESMRNCGNCGISARKCAGYYDWVPITIQEDCVDNGMKHWQPRGNDEGGAL